MNYNLTAQKIQDCMNCMQVYGNINIQIHRF